jgi:methionine synthase II (cobalamin-independent)
VDVIRRDTPIEDLVNSLPESVGYLLHKGIQAIACGEPIWGTLEDAAKREGYTDPQIDEIVADLSALLAGEERGPGMPSGES